jgi:hypothetical protein
MFRNLVIGVLPALLLVGARAEAAPPWTVSEVSGDVRLSENGRTRPATKGLLLGSGAVIATAPGARAVLVRGQEFVVISPGSRLRLPAAESPNRIVQMIRSSVRRCSRSRRSPRRISVCRRPISPPS